MLNCRAQNPPCFQRFLAALLGFDIVFIDETNSCEFQVTVLFFGGIDAPFVMLIGAAQIVTKL